MVNVHALQEIIPVIRELAAQQRFNMHHWANGEVNPHAETYQECGTQFCLAGAKAAVDGWRPQYETWSMVDGGEPVYSATGKFVRPKDRHYQGWAQAHYASDIAADGFDLNEHQAAWLFHATHIDDVEHMVTRIEWLINNPNSNYPGVDYPDELRNAEPKERDDYGDYGDDDDDEYGNEDYDDEGY